MDTLFLPFQPVLKESESAKKRAPPKKRSAADADHKDSSDRGLERMQSIEVEEDDRSLSLDSFDWTPPDSDEDRLDSLSWAQSGFGD